MATPAQKLKELQTSYRATIKDWLALPPTDAYKKAELIDGVITMSPEANWMHQNIAAVLSIELGKYLQRTRLGKVFPGGNVAISKRDGLIPDVVVFLTEKAAKLGDMTALVFEGAPDIVVEILSPSTGRRDLTTKRALYEQAGVPEYWIVDPRSKTVTLLELHQGMYRERVSVGVGGRLKSPLLPRFSVRVSDLFE